MKRHPDLFLKSLASMEAKAQYMRERLNKKPAKEPTFPLLLQFNYSQVIRPRCDLLLHNKVNEFDLAEVLRYNDFEFCKKFNLNYPDIEKLKQRRIVDEKDQMWVYVPTN